MPGRLGAWLVGVAVAAAALHALWAPLSVPPAVGRGSPAPPFSLPRLGGGGTLALADLGGKVVLLNFWATWCKPCEDEMPAMERLYRAVGREDFELVAVSVDQDAAEVAAFRDRLGLTFPILLDPTKEVAGSYQTFRFPETLLIGRDGTVAERYVGPKEWDAAPYLARVRRLLDGASDS